MSLIERLQLTTQATNWPGSIPLTYRYTAGRAGDKFLRAIKEQGKLIGTHCADCDITYVPPRIYCEECFARLEDAYVDVPSTGVVETFTVSFEDYQGNPKDPSIVAVIRLDDTDGGLVHWLGEVDLEEVCIGLVVEAKFKAKKSRKGSILDIEYFRPVE